MNTPDPYRKPAQILLLASLLFIIGVGIMALGAESRELAPDTAAATAPTTTPGSTADAGVKLGVAWYTGLVLAVLGGGVAGLLFLFLLGKRLLADTPYRLRDRAAVVLGLAVLPPFLFLVLLLVRGVAALG